MVNASNFTSGSWVCINHGVMGGTDSIIGTAVQGYVFSGINFNGAIFDGNTDWGEISLPSDAVNVDEQEAVEGPILDFRGADLTNAQFVGITIDGATFENAILSGTQFIPDDNGNPTVLTNVNFGTFNDNDNDGNLDLPIFDETTQVQNIKFGDETVSAESNIPVAISNMGDSVSRAIHNSLNTLPETSTQYLTSMGFQDSLPVFNNVPVFTPPSSLIIVNRKNKTVNLNDYFTDSDGNPNNGKGLEIENDGPLPDKVTISDNTLIFGDDFPYGVYNININLQTTNDSDPYGRVIKGNLSIAIGDPYIYPMRSATPVKLPDVEACYRLYQCNNTFINAEVSIATNEHEQRMAKFVEKLGHNIKHLVTDGYFLSKFYIVDGKNKLLIDLRKKYFSLVEGSDKNFFHNSMNENETGNKHWNGKAKNVIVQWITEEGNQMKATVSFFENPHIENGISLSVTNLPQKALGLCVSNYRPKLMRIPSLTTEKYAKIAKKVKKSRNPFQKLAIKAKNEKWLWLSKN